MKKTPPFLLLLCALFALLGCQHDAEQIPPRAAATLVYMAADNNLDYYAMLNIRQMERGLPEGAGPLFVLLTRRAGASPAHPHLIKITRNTADDSVVRSPIVHVYRQQNTADAGFLKKVIADVKKLSQSSNAELRRLVLWSHGTGWLPEGAPFNDDDETAKRAAMPPVFSFGLDETGSGNGKEYNREMNIKDLAQALAGNHFEAIVIDACFMGSVEVVYELRNYADYFIASPTEIVAGGFPYEVVTAQLVANALNPFSIAQAFFDHYHALAGALQTAAISVVNTKHLDGLAQAMDNFHADYVTVRESMQISDVLQYDRTGSNYFFGFMDFVNSVSKLTGKDYSRLKEIYSKAVPLYLHTKQVFGVLDLAGSSGLSIYIPNMNTTREELHSFYQKLSWAKDSNAARLFD